MKEYVENDVKPEIERDFVKDTRETLPAAKLAMDVLSEQIINGCLEVSHTSHNSITEIHRSGNRMIYTIEVDLDTCVTCGSVMKITPPDSRNIIGKTSI